LLLELSRYLDGELSPSRRRIVERHISSCTCCGTMEVRLRTVVAACRAEGSQRPPRTLTARAARRVKKLLAGEA
jgi:anti-sigma factor RsiW